MKKLFLAILSWLLVFVTSAQESRDVKSKFHTASLADSIRKYFNYDTLRYIPCLQVPAGVYALGFKIGNNRKPYGYEFSQDSLAILKNLFIGALEHALRTQSFQMTAGKKYMQLIYYNNFLGCLALHDTISDPGGIHKEMSDFLANQLHLIERSFTYIRKNDSTQYFFLKAVVINNDNPNRPQLQKSFNKDFRKATQSELPKEQMQRMIQEVGKKKTEKVSN